MKKDDIRRTSAYRQMAANVFGEHQAAWMEAQAKRPNAPSDTLAQQRAELREMHEETLARIGQPTTPRTRKPAAKRQAGSKGKK